MAPPSRVVVRMKKGPCPWIREEGGCVAVDPGICDSGYVLNTDSARGDESRRFVDGRSNDSGVPMRAVDFGSDGLDRVSVR